MGAVTEYRTAPSFFLLGRGKNPNTVRWSVKDRVLTLAVLSLEKEKCPHCGVPVWHGQTADSRVEFSVEWRVCYGCAEKHEHTKDGQAKPGEWATVRAVPIEEGESLPTRLEGLKNIAVPLHQGGDSSAKPTGPGAISE